ncbi:hypothetical protein [Leeuwenhoekiella sp. NPDC079379]|uniref:hypothetical protein n=1 Tax=Leeuwenhoekiella sp. NPDC079379 TaxID=3364122 RepID=UPI0037C56DE7
MNKKSITYLLSLTFWGYGVVALANDAKNPPPPMNRALNPGVPGLRLPIDDYIPFFIVFALIVGVVFIYNKERSKILTP